MTFRLPSARTFPILFVLAAGAANALAFAPFGAWPLQLVLLALLFWYVLRQDSIRYGVLVGWAYGFGWLAAGVHWLYISMHRYGGLPGWMAILAVALLAFALGSFAGLATGGSLWLRKRWSVSTHATALLILPAMWALTEWSRGWFLTGFPWVSSGYAHTDGPLAGFAPLIGVYGVAWVAALIAGCVALLPANKLPVGITVALFAIGAGLKTIDWTSPSGAPISVRLLQGNVPQDLKFEPEQIQSTLTLYHDMISARPADLIATPETAIPLLSTQLPPDYLGLLSGYARRSNSHLMLGIPISDGPRLYANSAIGISPAPETKPYRYDKHHLVPFGEFIPLGARWFVDMMKIPLGDFTRGSLMQEPFAVRDQWVLPNICYEDLFGEEIAAQLAGGRAAGRPQATVLLNMSNIAWFGDSVAVPQHLQISRMRSIETGRPMLRATNTGATAVVGPKGDVLVQLRPFEFGEISTSVQGYAGLTPYTQYGNASIVGLAFLMLGMSRLYSRRNPHKAMKNR